MWPVSNPKQIRFELVQFVRLRHRVQKAELQESTALQAAKFLHTAYPIAHPRRMQADPFRFIANPAL